MLNINFQCILSFVKSHYIGYYIYNIQYSYRLVLNFISYWYKLNAFIIQGTIIVEITWHFRIKLSTILNSISIYTTYVF